MGYQFVTINDAIRMAADWTARYTPPPTHDQIVAAAHDLVGHVGGYNIWFEREDIADFDLDTALYGEEE